MEAADLDATPEFCSDTVVTSTTATFFCQQSTEKKAS